MVGAIGKENRAAAPWGIKNNLWKDSLSGLAFEVGPTRQCVNASVARSEACALSRQDVVWGARADDDPVGVVTRFLWKLEFPGESSACLQLQRIAALCAVDGSLQIVPRFHLMNRTGGRRIHHRTLYGDSRQFGRAIEPPGRILRLCLTETAGGKKKYTG